MYVCVKVVVIKINSDTVSWSQGNLVSLPYNAPLKGRLEDGGLVVRVVQKPCLALVRNAQAMGCPLKHVISMRTLMAFFFPAESNLNRDPSQKTSDKAKASENSP